MRQVRFEVSGYAEKGPERSGSEAGLRSGGNLTFSTGWVRSTEPGEEVCYLLTGDWAGGAEFRFSECVQMDEVTGARLPPYGAV